MHMGSAFKDFVFLDLLLVCKCVAGDFRFCIVFVLLL